MYLHLRVNNTIKPVIRHPLANIRVKFRITNLVAFLILPIAGEILLDGVVGEMHAAGTDIK